MTNNTDTKKRRRAMFLGASTAVVVILAMTLVTPLSLTSAQAQVRDTDLPIGIGNPDDLPDPGAVRGSIFDCVDNFNPEFNAFWACLRAATEPPE
jgi:hypothetical protein